MGRARRYYRAPPVLGWPRVKSYFLHPRSEPLFLGASSVAASDASLGEWPWWNPYVGGGQSAVADALHQMFLLPVLAVRLVGSEVLSFNLWVALPFPIAAAGAWALLARRCSASGAGLGAIAFAISGPIISTGNFPNLSWSVAAVPWVVWAVDRLSASPRVDRMLTVAAVVAFQALAGEPVTFSATALVAVAYGVCGIGLQDTTTPPSRLRVASYTVAGLALGAALAAVQLMPLVEAARSAQRSTSVVSDLWSLNPLSLVETLVPHFFGDYFKASSMAATPWLPFVNTGREPFFFSLYYGVALCALALFGLMAGGRAAWGIFWAAVGGASVVLAFGVHTPVFPWLRDNLPLVSCFASRQIPRLPWAGAFRGRGGRLGCALVPSERRRRALPARASARILRWFRVYHRRRRNGDRGQRSLFSGVCRRSCCSAGARADRHRHVGPDCVHAANRRGRSLC